MTASTPFVGRVQRSEDTWVADEIVVARYECERLDGSVAQCPMNIVSEVTIPRGYKEVRVSIAPYDIHDVPNDLQFGVFSLIGVDELIDDNWALGQILSDNGKSMGPAGSFPLNYTQTLNVPCPASPSADQLFEVSQDVEQRLASEISLRAGERVQLECSDRDGWAQVRTADGRSGKCPEAFLRKITSESAPLYDPVSTTSTPVCRALFDFDADYEGELTLKEGQMVRLIKKWNTDWFEGEYDEDGVVHRGVFPSNHVEIVVDTYNQSDLNASEAEIESKRYGAVESVEPETIGYATVLYDFEARFQDEISVQAGFSVRIVQVLDGEWAQCWNPVNCQQGLVPIGFLQVFLDDDEVELPFSTSQTEPDFSTSLPASASQDLPWDTPFPHTFSASAPVEVPKEPLDSGNVSLASTNGDAKQVVDREFEELFGLKPPKAEPPRRPPPPQAREPPECARSPPAPTPKSTVSNETWQSQFQKIIEELLASETNYNLELHAWEECIRSSAKLSEQRKCVLVNGFPMLKDLSQRLIRLISNEMDKPPERQCYGLLFMDLREKMTKTYAYHFRCVEEMAQIVDNKNDVELQAALSECLKEMNNMGVFVFDVPTAVSRPIQRVLKYPLFIGELIKTVPLTHPDHPKLLEANKQLADLVSKMNESKRKKELMVKYRDLRSSSITDRLSKLNMHTFVKKSNRLKYRIAATMGLTNKPDPEFTAMVSEMDLAERRLCKFLYHVQVYRARLTFMVKKYVGQHTVDSKSGKASNVDDFLRREFNLFLKKVAALLKEHMNIVTPCQQLQKCEYAKLIEKRCDKLADYELAKAGDRGFDEIEKKRCEFEALNQHVKNNLPKIWTSIHDKIRKLAELLVQSDASFFSRTQALLKGTPKNMFTLSPFEQFVDPNLQRLVNIQKFIHSNKQRVDKKSLRKSFREVFAENKRNHQSSVSQRPQNERERDALIKILKAENRLPDLRKVICDYSSPRMILRKGDVVVIISFSNGYCLCENGVSTDQVPLHILVPVDEFYSPTHSPSASASAAKSDPPKPIPRPPTISNGFSTTKTQQVPRQQSQNLIDLSTESPKQSPPVAVSAQKPTVDQLLDLDFSAPPAQPVPTQVQAAVLSPMELVDYEKEPGVRAGPSFAELAALSPALHQSVPPSLTTPLAPQRPAPNPPVPNRNRINRTPLPNPVPVYSPRQNSKQPAAPSEMRQAQPAKPFEHVDPIYDQVPFCSASEVHTAPPPLPTQPRPTSLSLDPKKVFVCEFDFSPTQDDGSQLRIREKDTVIVHRDRDEVGNQEWWLVELTQPTPATPKTRGYVPGVYLRPATQTEFLSVQNRP